MNRGLFHCLKFENDWILSFAGSYDNATQMFKNTKKMRELFSF